MSYIAIFYYLFLQNNDWKTGAVNSRLLFAYLYLLILIRKCESENTKEKTSNNFISHFRCNVFAL